VKCYRHPREDAIYECANCGKPICGECMRFTDDSELITCPECGIEGFREITEKADIEESEYQDKIQEEYEIKATWRDRLKIEINSWLVIAVAVLFAVHFAISPKLKDIEDKMTFSDFRITEGSQIAPQFAYLLAQIFKYREKYNKWPESLDKLGSDLIDSNPTILKTNETYKYVTDPQKGFVLSVPDAARFGFLKLYATSDGEIKIE
jgi:hypothetical protein